jgi:hypothetical protein
MESGIEGSPPCPMKMFDGSTFTASSVNIAPKAFKSLFLRVSYLAFYVHQRFIFGRCKREPRRQEARASAKITVFGVFDDPPGLLVTTEGLPATSRKSPREFL